MGIRFTQAEITRAVRGAIAGGMKVTRVEIERGGRIIVWGEHSGSDYPDICWDSVVAEDLDFGD